MSALIAHINIIQTKLLHLLKQHDLLQKENARQKQLLDTLEQELHQHKEKAEELKQQNLILKASVANMDALEKKELEQKIQLYIKNIDKCISLLSK